MQIPCPACGVLTRFETDSSEPSSSVLVICPGCAGRFRIAVQAPAPPTAESADYRRARLFAKDHGIDVPTAYSVLEGLISLDDVHGAHAAKPAGAGAPGERDRRPGERDGRPGAPPGRDRPTAPGRKRAEARPRASEEEGLGYDPEFAGAVRDGCLTYKQAIERGDRRALAARLSTRHRLPMNLAYQAADNRITIRQALMHKEALEAKAMPRASSSSSSENIWKLVAFVVAGLICGGVLLQLRSGHKALSSSAIIPTSEPGSEGHDPASSEAPAPDVPQAQPPLTVPRVDSAGQLVEIAGPDPRSVLVSFCMNGQQAGKRAPLDVVQAAPPSAGVRLGLFRSSANSDGGVRAILIRKDTLSSRWLAGNGRTPILTEEFADPRSSESTQTETRGAESPPG